MCAGNAQQEAGGGVPWQSQANRSPCRSDCYAGSRGADERSRVVGAIVARLGVCEQRTRSRHHIEREQFGGEGGGRQSERSRSKTILGKLRVAMWLWTERCSAQMLNCSLNLRRYHHAACSRRITCGMRRMTHTHATSDTPAVGPPPKPKKSRFFYAPSASAANALQSSLSGVSPMHASVR